MDKYICKYSERLKTLFELDISIIRGNLYHIHHHDDEEHYHLCDHEENWIGEIWGTISDYFVSIADWREIQINEILNDD